MHDLSISVHVQIIMTDYIFWLMFWVVWIDMGWETGIYFGDMRMLSIKTKLLAKSLANSVL